jgi:hypothetical protein
VIRPIARVGDQMQDLTCSHISTWEQPWEVSALPLDNQPKQSEARNMSNGHGEVPAPDYRCCENFVQLTNDDEGKQTQ